MDVYLKEYPAAPRFRQRASAGRRLALVSGFLHI